MNRKLIKDIKDSTFVFALGETGCEPFICEPPTSIVPDPIQRLLDEMNRRLRLQKVTDPVDSPPRRS
jgi:hypothetical protein